MGRLSILITGKYTMEFNKKKTIFIRFFTVQFLRDILLIKVHKWNIQKTRVMCKIYIYNFHHHLIGLKNAGSVSWADYWKYNLINSW